MQTMITLLNIISYISAIIVLISAIVAVVLWGKGILPVLLRLGNGLAKRKIAVFASNDNLSSIKSLLEDSNLFRQSIIEVPTKNDLGRADDASVYLVYWHDWSSEIDEILNKKIDKCPMIIYAPYDKGEIPKEKLGTLDGKRNTSVTRFRGRLLNDVVTAMITTKL